jgi:peroxiredoxin Q/BCP
MLKPSQVAPPFTLADSAGVQHSLATLLGKGPVLLLFYPADNSPLCTKQNCIVRDRFAELKAAGVSVVGLSPQGSSAKEAFTASHRLPQLLLIDGGSRVAAEYGARGMFGLPLPFGTRRMTFYVEPSKEGTQGEIALAAHQEFGLSAHEKLMDEALRLARAANTTRGVA